MNTDTSKFTKPLDKRRKKTGQTMPIVVGLVIFLLIAGFFFLNYSHILEQNLVGKTAAEAAALQFAKDMAKVVYTDPITGNKMALVDQPADELLAANSGNVDRHVHPILGVNTQIAINRLDVIIAAQCGNDTMKYAADYDWDPKIVGSSDKGGLKEQISAFNTLFTTRQAVDNWVDKGGNSINVYNDVQNFYKENLRLRGSNSTLVDNTLTFKFLYKKVTQGQPSNIATNVPAPATMSGSPEDVDKWEVNNGGRSANYLSVNMGPGMPNQLVYMAYQPYAAGDASQQCTAADNNGYSVTFNFPFDDSEPYVFTAVGPQPSILSNTDPNYQDWTGDGTGGLGNSLPPAIVQISAIEQNKQLQGSQDRTQSTQVATAQVGGPLQQYPTGAFCVGFPQGVPIDNTPNTFGMFHSVLSIMDWSQVSPKLTPDDTAPNIGWNSKSLGHWFRVANGPLFPGGPTTQQQQSTNAKFVHMHVIKGRLQHDDPSMACSFAAYDWIKSLGVYPKVDTIVRALSLSGKTSVADITKLDNHLAFSFPITASTGISVDAGSDPLFTMNPSGGDWLAAPAYADTTSQSQPAGLGYALASGNIKGTFTDCNTSTQDPTGDSLLTAELNNGAAAQDTKDPRNILNHCSANVPGENRPSSEQDADQTGAAFGNTDHNVVAPPSALVIAIQPDGTVTTANGSPLPTAVNLEAALSSTSFDDAGDVADSGPTGAYQNGYAAWGNASGLAISDPPPGVKSAVGVPKNGVQADGTGGLTQVKPSQIPATLVDGTTQYSNFSIDQDCKNIAADLKYINNQLKSDPTLSALPSSDPNLTAVTNAVTSIKSSNDDIQNTQNVIKPNIIASDSGYNGDKLGTALSAIDTDAKAINTQCNNLLNGNSTASPAITALPSGSTSPWLKVIAALKEIQTMAAGSLSGNTPTSNAGGDILSCNAVKKRAINVVNNAFYIGTVVNQIIANQKVLTGVGLSPVGNSTTHFLLAGADLWCMPSGKNCAEDLIEGSGKVPTGQDSACPGVQDWAADLPTGTTAYNGSKSQMVLYKITANAQAGYPAIGSNLISAAYAQQTGTTSSGAQYIAANANMRMLIFSMGTNGDIWVTVSPQSPFATTGLLDGQYVYQNILAVNQNVPSPGQGQEFWLAEARDLNGNPNGDYFANENAAVGARYNSQWCIPNSIFGSYSKHPPTCQHVAAEFRISCPIYNQSCKPVTSLNLDGTAGPGNTCPPPNPCGS